MYDTWLILDGNFLCYRAMHIYSDLEYNGESTGIAFGFLTDLLCLQERFQAEYACFCFDLGTSFRAQKYPVYKANRHRPKKNATPEEQAETQRQKKVFRSSVRKLRTEVLPNIGYVNVFSQAGIEGDDWIARCCEVIETNWPTDEKIIISGDHDLFQCLNGTTKMFSPTHRRLMTLQQFCKTYCVSPASWPIVKAVAGCSSDNIKGMRGVGEKTILKFLTGKLNAETKTYRRIEEEMPAITKQNLPLTKLPWRQTPTPDVEKTRPDQNKWNQVVRDMGMKTLVNQGPYKPIKRRR